MKNQTLKLITASLCLICFINLVNAQGHYRLNNSIDIVVGADLGYRLIQETKNHQEVQQKENRDNLERLKSNYRFGLNYIQGLSSRFCIRTGLRYANPGFTILNAEKLDLSKDINAVEKKYSLHEGLDYKYSYHILEIPLGIRYVVSNSACNPYIEAGIAPSFYLNTKIKEEGSSSFLKKEAISEWNYIAFFSTGGDFALNDKLNAFTQIMARYQLNNLRQAAEIKEQILSVGIETGIRLQF